LSELGCGDYVVLERNDVFRVRVANGNTAHVISSLDLEISGITPGISPRVLNDPIGNFIFNSITDSKNGVVNIIWGIFASS